MGGFVSARKIGGRDEMLVFAAMNDQILLVAYIQRRQEKPMVSWWVLNSSKRLW